MMKRIFVVLPLFMSASVMATTCPYDPNFIGLTYRITTKNLKPTQSQFRPTFGQASSVTKKVKKTGVSTLNIWRRNQQVLHERSDSDISDIWLKHSDDLLSLVRYFDRYERGIDYEPFDLRRKTTGLWDTKWQIVPEVYLKQMTKTGEAGQGCEKVEFYAYSTVKRHYLLTWSPAKRTPVSYLNLSGQQLMYWELIRTTTDLKTVSDAMDKREDFDVTDFADVGDNEDDPFLLKMIRLGFIWHGSGFYDKDGNPVTNGFHRH